MRNLLAQSCNASNLVATNSSPTFACPISCSNWLHRLRIVEQFCGIIGRLEILQPRKAFSVIRLTRRSPVQPRVSVVDVHSPVIFCQRRRDVGYPVVEEVEAIGRVRAEEYRVVELDEVELVSMGVGGCAEVAVGDGGVCTAWFCVSVYQDVVFGMRTRTTYPCKSSWNHQLRVFLGPLLYQYLTKLLNEVPLRLFSVRLLA